MCPLNEALPITGSFTSTKIVLLYNTYMPVSNPDTSVNIIMHVLEHMLHSPTSHNPEGWPIIARTTQRNAHSDREKTVSKHAFYTNTCI